jgi:ferrous iron transport protein B
MGYFVAFITYQLGTLITTGSLGQGFIFGAIICAVLIAVLIYAVRRGNKVAAEPIELFAV